MKDRKRVVLIIFCILFVSVTINVKAGNCSNSKIYIDSVPSGADVYLLSEGEAKNSDKHLGKTPLVVSASECKGFKFWVKIEMEYFYNKMGEIPSMKKWVEKNRAMNQYNTSMYFNESPFDFDVSTSQNVTSVYGRLIATGPVYEINWPKNNRICVFFLPKKHKLSDFTKLMPRKRSFPGLSGDWINIMRHRYNFSPAQIKEALTVMPRCGKYNTTVRISSTKGGRYVIVFQKKPLDYFTIDYYEYRIIPGYND